MSENVKTSSISESKSKGWSFGLIKKSKKVLYSAISLGVGMLLWFLPAPEAVDPKGWHLLAIFVATIVGVVLKPFPMGAIALFSLAISIVTGTLTFTEAFSGFGNNVVWLIVFAFFIARGFIATGLGNRIAYFFMSFLGKSSLGLSYGMVATDLLLAPTIPSVTARSGGVIYPILRSVSKAFGSDVSDGTQNKIGAFLIKVAFQTSAVTSAMFLTSMAANPLISQLAGDAGVTLSWGKWALAGIVPGLVSLIVIPFLIYKMHPPEIKKTPDAKDYSKKKLAEMGKMTRNEWVMIGTFGLLLVLWIFGSSFGISATTAALVGLSLLLITDVLKWKEVLEERSAWDTLFWFSVLVTLASFLNKFGITTWFSSLVVTHVGGFSPFVAFGILALFYFYSHYFFASNLAHVGAMYAPFLLVSIALGMPGEFAALVLAFFSSLFGGLTHYGSGPAPLLYGSGYVPISTWWKVGGIASIVNVTIWLVVGGLWWKVIGLW
jgi:divalent anion:Na+ symporter, DASS family